MSSAPNLVIVNTRVANLASVDFAFQRLGINATISADPAVIRAASHVVLPGVGTAGAAMRSLAALELIPVLQQLTQPVLGICLGMQMLTTSSAEVSSKSASQHISCLGVIPGTIERLPAAANLPLPHMGWNQTQVQQADGSCHPIFAGLAQPWFYYVHSFAAPVGPSTIAECQYGSPFAAAIAHNNFIGVQFHPERSGADGERVLQNFLELTC